ncbi:MAG: secretin N-terminal domain-containing protein [Selenomonadaceae bacterium]|nr:secretin N-terminal domain-containing protein [Selenomonadaceae bacterium]
MKNYFCKKLTAVCVGAMLYGSGLTAVSAEAISLDFRNADVRGVFTQIAELGGIGLVMDESVRGRLTISLSDVDPWEAAEIVAMTRGLSISRRGDTLVVTTGGAGGSSLYGVHVFRIENAELDTLAEAVDMAFGGSDDYDDYGYNRDRRNDSTASDNYRSRQRGNEYGQRSSTTSSTGNRHNERLRGRRSRTGVDNDRRVSCDYQTNSLIFYGTSAEAEQVRRMVKELDVPAKQIALEARVLAISKEAAKNLGVQWQWSSVPQYPERETTYESRRQVVQNPDGTYTTVTVDVPKVNVKRSWGNNGYGIVQFGRGPEGHPFEFYYGATINALITDGKAKVLARPNITTIQGHEAVINIGGEVPVTETSVTNSTTTTSVSYKDAGIILRYTPRVNGDGTITAEVHTEVSSPLYVEEMKAYRFQSRSADTTVRLRDGETMVIGGLIGSEEAKTLSKVPFLGDLPILGAFFRNVKKSKTDSEIMIFLTAHVLDDDKIRSSTAAAEERAAAAQTDGKGKK